MRSEAPAPEGLTGEQIRRRLEALAARWSVYEGSERAEAQTFLNELFARYGQDRQAVARFEEPQSGRFVDLIWPRVCIVEMKAPSEAGRLARHREQALDYWRNAADPERGVEAPRFVVLCAFRRLEIWEPGRFPKGPRETLELSELPEQYASLQFLAGDEPVFTGGQARLTREAVEHVTEIFHRLGGRRAAPPDVLREFLLQSVWSMFGEDLGQIPGHRFTRIVDELLAQRARSSADDLGGLFTTLNDPRPARAEHGLYAGVPYANGGLFQRPAQVHLDVEELGLLRVACGFNWREVDPQIFGSLLEKGLGRDTQWQLGAHYTHAADIQKVVQPTVVRPWGERIENLSTHAEAVAAQEDLTRCVVLDPACGSGNFLYVAYRELRRLEHRLRERENDLHERAGLRGRPQASLAFFPPGPSASPRPCAWTSATRRPPPSRPSPGPSPRPSKARRSPTSPSARTSAARRSAPSARSASRRSTTRSTTAPTSTCGPPPRPRRGRRGSLRMAARRRPRSRRLERAPARPEEEIVSGRRPYAPFAARAAVAG